MRFGTLQNVLNTPLPEVFDVAAILGFDGVEIDWNALADAQPGGSLGPDRREQLRAAAAQAGVEICSVAAHFHNQGGLGATEDAVRRSGRDAIRTGIRLCQDLGARVLLVPFFGPGTIHDAGGVSRLEADLRELAPEAELARVTLGIEHTLPAAEAAALIDRLGSPFIGDYWDMANAMGLGYDPLAEVRTLGSRLARVHAKEWHGEGGPAATQSTPRFDLLNTQPLGSGSVPIGDVIRALRDVGYDGYIVLETGSFGNHQESARAALALLQRS
jgi:sugar phosphate isomerase/epimerase